MKKDKLQILKVLVGSQAHGLANEDSDHDYRAVYVNATTEILSIGHTYKGSHWVEGENVDQTAYEIGHFLKLATKCNPTALEVLRAPVIESHAKDIAVEAFRGSYPDYVKFDVGKELRDLFPYIWNPKDAFNAFVGYSSNQRKKMLDKKDNRGPKFACAYLRTLYSLNELLEFGTFDLEVKDQTLKNLLIEIRNGEFKPGQVIDIAEGYIEIAKMLRDQSTQEPDLDKVHDFLMKVRKTYWEL
jgi:predicted nucleotidyltransferase